MTPEHTHTPAPRPVLRRGPGPLATHAWRAAASGLAAASVALRYGFDQPPLPVGTLYAAELIAFAVIWAPAALGWLRGWPRFEGDRPGWLDGALAAAVALGAGCTALGLGGWALVSTAVVIACVTELGRLSAALSRVLPRPGMLLPLSFFVLITLGTLLLLLPRATPSGQPIHWLDALFTATSAVCVTGLTVRTTATGFTPLGQGIIVLLIQLGGLGILIFGSALAMLLGKRLSLREHLTMREVLSDQPIHRVAGFGRFIVLATLGIELAGAVALYPLWEPAAGQTLTEVQRAGLSVFHSVSAFCNAGFDITGQSLEAYRRAALTHAVIAPLIVIGGLGFPALDNLFAAARTRLSEGLRRLRGLDPLPVDLRRRRLTLHTKVVLAATLGLYLYGTAGVFAGQLAAGVRWEALGPGAVGGMLADASFFAITSRTAGFNAVPMDELEPAGRLTVMTLMLVGGSPGSTAGGIKTTVVAVLALSVIATIRQRAQAEAFSRTVADAVVRRAATLGVCYLGLVAAATLLLLLSEPRAVGIEVLLFEVISASTTTGLSLGVTGDLTGFGEAVIIAAMYLGRVGPLALLAALAFGTGRSRPYAYPHEDVVLG